jgi:heme/copper-type cytochrome/quinol oxidase subunit 2
VSTIVHLALALTLTVFLAVQIRALVAVWRARRVHGAGRGRRPGEALWTAIPVLVVLCLAARSWLVVLEPERPAAASAVRAATLPAAPAPPSR